MSGLAANEAPATAERERHVWIGSGEPGGDERRRRGAAQYSEDAAGTVAGSCVSRRRVDGEDGRGADAARGQQRAQDGGEEKGGGAGRWWRTFCCCAAAGGGVDLLLLLCCCCCCSDLLLLTGRQGISSEGCGFEPIRATSWRALARFANPRLALLRNRPTFSMWPIPPTDIPFGAPAGAPPLVPPPKSLGTSVAPRLAGTTAWLLAPLSPPLHARRTVLVRLSAPPYNTPAPSHSWPLAESRATSPPPPPLFVEPQPPWPSHPTPIPLSPRLSRASTATAMATTRRPCTSSLAGPTSRPGAPLLGRCRLPAIERVS